ncbi:hypothetical protein BDN70DRAFT_592172 [Pholiota conissans]|uniref:Uncharacterized protein n=1 Tax=Pholiota conissans TaxID=109636 RepID=A0A9P5ZEK2_9AGAR|nr:hypothetical protein BDN70DRAFT_592172 [Pholiota conissans]
MGSLVIAILLGNEHQVVGNPWGFGQETLEGYNFPKLYSTSSKHDISGLEHQYLAVHNVAHFPPIANSPAIGQKQESNSKINYIQFSQLNVLQNLYMMPMTMTET